MSKFRPKERMDLRLPAGNIATPGTTYRTLLPQTIGWRAPFAGVELVLTSISSQRHEFGTQRRTDLLLKEFSIVHKLYRTSSKVRRVALTYCAHLPGSPEWQAAARMALGMLVQDATLNRRELRLSHNRSNYVSDPAKVSGSYDEPLQ